jgi:tetratricopeptide (TPR) repeat protein
MTEPNRPHQESVLRKQQPGCSAEAVTTPHAGKPPDDASTKKTNEARSSLGPGESTLDLPPVGARTPASANWPKIPGYEILSELGRGGMGVVYKARHTGLNRLVALKMIRSGAQAGEEELARFHLEAEAVARLQHPNIVQIYDIGAHEGRPFFSLEFVDGGTLAQRLDGQPLPPGDAAQLIQNLARGVHAAHQRGIVHRDLKPANVLLAGGGVVNGASGDTSHYSPLTNQQPKIADFGLAKQLDADAGQTHTGQIMGTPSYMAPEQAAGKVREIGPATDIYALGAILYELLTGKPAFKGDTVLDTLELVRRQEPVPLRQVQAGVPHALEVICLKAMSKEPRRRYSSALALAQDLERFLAGEPILARPESLAGRLWRRFRQRAGAFAAALVVIAALAAGAYFFWSARSASRVADFAAVFEPRLQKILWTEDYLAETEALIAELEPVDPERARAARAKLFQQFAQSIRLALRTETALGREDITRINSALALLTNRQPDLEAALQKDLSDRLGAMQTVRDLRPPFTDADKILVSGAATVNDGMLLPGAHPDDPVILTRDVCQGSVQLEVEFDVSWGKVKKLGLLLDANADKRRNYTFLLSTIPAETSKASPGEVKLPLSLEESRAKGREVFLQILRNGALLRQQALAAGRLSKKPLTLRAAREGSFLTFEVLQGRTLVDSLRFQDLFPPGGTEAAVFGLHWPDGVGLRWLQARIQTLPPSPGPLEEADHFYAVGEVEKALAIFQREAAVVLDAKLRQEARCKEALCLVALHRQEEAARLLAPLCGEAGERWPLVAACQLWLIYLRQNRAVEAESLVESLLSRGYSADRLAAVFPEDLRQNLWLYYNKDFSGFTLLFQADPKRVAGLERLAAIHDLLALEGYQRAFFHQKLVRAYRLTGEDRKAFEFMRGIVQGEVGPSRGTGPGAAVPVYQLEEFSWLAREQGRAAEALEPINRHLALSQSEPAYHALRVERARLYAALNRWQEAEADLTEFLRLVAPTDANYQWFSGACLLQGFLRERRGDRKGALESWTCGLPDPRITPGAHEVRQAGTGVLHLFLLYCLTDRLSDEVANRFQERLLASLPKEFQVTSSAFGYRPPVAVFRKMWQSPRGREAAKKLAFQSVSLREYLQLPLRAGAATLALEAIPNASAEQERLVWKTAEDLLAATLSGKLTKAQGFQLAMTWKGTTGVFGWAGLAPHLTPKLRGPVAYVLGHRYLRMGKAKDAAEFFRTAAKDAPDGSALGQLTRVAQKSLERANSK